jgi:hypothetical protein
MNKEFQMKKTMSWTRFFLNTLIAISVVAITGCGGGGSSSGSVVGVDDVSPELAGTEGVIVDPYITDAILVEVSPDGTIIQESSKSDALGRFLFKKPVKADSTVRTKVGAQGIHNGEPFRGILKTLVNGKKSFVLSPITTLAANGASGAEVLSLLSQAGLGGVTEDQLMQDPMAGIPELAFVEERDLDLLRAALSINALFDLNDNYDLGVTEFSENSTRFADLAGVVMETVNVAAFNQMVSENASILNSIGHSLTLDHAVAASVKVTDTVVEHLQLDASLDPYAEAMALMVYAPELALQYFVKESRGDSAVEQAIAVGQLPDIQSDVIIEINESGEIINDSPGSFEFSVSAYEVSEDAGQVEITINRFGGSDGTVSVDWRTLGVSATFAEDYGSFDWTTIVFADGETTRTEVVTIVDDSIDENDETFKVLLNNPTGGATIGSLSESLVTIIDDDITIPVPGAFEFSVTSTSVDEGAGVVTIAIERVGGSDGTVTVDWRTLGDTATFEQDYGNFDWITLTFVDGESVKNKSITIVDDSIYEGNEVFDVLLGNPTGGASLASKITTSVTIIDNDESVVVEPPVYNGPLPVFPGAEGFGTETVAGRGGEIIKVTNLNDSGAGSLRAAVSYTGPRIIVFEVGGLIDLSDNIVVNSPYITIAGQTAPSPGVTLRGAGIVVSTHDVLIQHLRVRVGDGLLGPDPGNRDCIQINNPAYNVVVDHGSFSWATDENGSTFGAQENITFSNSIFSEGLYDSIHPEGLHSMGLLVGDHVKKVSIVGNLMAHNNERNPLAKGDASMVVLNNLVYNSGTSTRLAVVDDRSKMPTYVSAVGNVFIDGPDTPYPNIPIRIFSSVVYGSEIYHNDNQASGSILRYDTSFDPQVSAPPVWHDSHTVRDSSLVEGYVLSNAGARPADRDAVDLRIVKEVRSRSGEVINSQRKVGGWQKNSPSKRAFIVPVNANGDDDGDGYTNIEEVLHQMAKAVE